MVVSAAEQMPLRGETSFEMALDAERTRLVRFCAHLTGNPGVAEDLAQETLLEAWRNQHKFSEQDLTHPAKRASWLKAIARNVCLRWERSQGRDLAHLARWTSSVAGEEEPGLDLDELPTGDAGLEVELERDELARLLDRALALLPPTTRAVLIERYIHESPHHEIAERLGLSEDALVQRLYRGKLALRRVIETELNAEAAAYGLVAAQHAMQQMSEQETRIRCPMCNQGWLVKSDESTTGRISFCCSSCWMLASTRPSPRWQGLRSPKSILRRQLIYLSAYYWQAINHGEVACQECGHPAHARVLSLANSVLIHRCPNGNHHGLAIRCEHCENEDINPLSHLTLDIPETQQFWKQHGRIFWLPEHEINYAGQPALLSGFQSATDSARLDIIYQRETLKILGIHETN